MNLYQIGTGHYFEGVEIGASIEAEDMIVALKKVISAYPKLEFTNVTISKIEPGIVMDQ